MNHQRDISGGTLKLLADELVALEIIESISYRTVQRTLKKTNLGLT